MSGVGDPLVRYSSLEWWRSDALPVVTDKLMRAFFGRFPRNRCEIMREDWDNLLIIDACRYDMFKQRNTIPGRLDSRLSLGSSTAEVFEQNFLGTHYYDTVYVTANPVPRVEKFCSVDVDTVFHEVIDVWKHSWDQDVNTVRPPAVKSAIERAHTNYPDKRILGHFIQPHQPFIGETGRRIDESGMRAYDELTGNETEGSKIWERLEQGEISSELVWEAYCENLDLVLPYVAELCDELAGKTVVTSDHGNLIGEFAWPFPVREYGHPRGIHTKRLIKVPWLELDHDTRRNTVSERPSGSTTTMEPDDGRLERLHDLGYR